MKCTICFGDHPTKDHKKLVKANAFAKDGDAGYKCPGCGRYVSAKELRDHKKRGCASAVGVPTAPMRSHDDDQLQQSD